MYCRKKNKNTQKTEHQLIQQMYGVKEVRCASDIIDNECYIFQIIYFFLDLLILKK